jgi:hypothetical protein
MCSRVLHGDAIYKKKQNQVVLSLCKKKFVKASITRPKKVSEYNNPTWDSNEAYILINFVPS